MEDYVAELIQEIKNLDLENEDINKVAEAFAHVDKKKEGSVDIDSLGDLLDEVGKPLPGFKIRQMLPTLSLKTSGRVNVLEFGSIYHDQVKKDIASSFRKTIDAAEGVVSKTGASSWSTHTYSLEEREAFADWINTRLKDDPDCKNLLPITVDDESLFEKVSDGILLCKLINLSQPETIDERAINKTKLSVYRKQENLNLAINSASAIGCTVVNIGAQDLLESRQHLILGLLWQIIRMGLFANIDLALNPNLKALLMDGEELADLDKLGPEKLLLRWMNYHLARAGYSKTVANFGKDISDSHAYLNLLAQIQPADLSPPLSAFFVAGDDLSRAEAMLKNADRLGCRAFVTARDVANGHDKLNMAFVANLFNNHPSLEPPSDDENDEVIEETGDERTYRNWMNSLGVQPRVNRLYGDLIDGNVLLQLEDIVKPGIVNWERVNRAPFPRIGAMMKRIENCNYAVDLGKELKYSLIGIAGNDIYDQNRTLTLALVWQIMRGYTTKVLTDLGGNTQIRDAEIVDWVNQTLASGGKTSKISSFKDSSIASSQAILDVIDVLVPDSIDYSVVLSDPSDYEDKLQNAKYALAMGRKIGARIYATPEHVVNVDMKMVLTIFACLMGRGMERT
ncbi:unnamed protein product [Oikopleura dioica]|uniref:Uncharacterized protein n=1 Tax=Oikopleura dioica TaxID=34765 RepID=E4WWY3_OIKDI|nr:unnamed protein product [Oikopleura dioica]